MSGAISAVEMKSKNPKQMRNKHMGAGEIFANQSLSHICLMSSSRISMHRGRICVVWERLDPRFRDISIRIRQI
jgi:hypothetical protein